MFTAIILLLSGVAAWVAVGVLPYFRRKTLGKTEAMRWVETSAATDTTGMAAGTPVEVKGTLRCESLLESEMAGRPAPTTYRRWSESTRRRKGTPTGTWRRAGARRW